MNAIINWLALNNTLMIKIGFSAIILLIVVYVFRFFFVPRVKQVSDPSELVDSEDLTPNKNEAPKDTAVAFASEDITKLHAEISTLKYKLKEAEAEKASLANQATTSGSVGNAAAAGAGLEMVSEATTQNTAAQGELEEKIKLLEARLSEYEIIAEDIAEISKLRQENEELKAKISIGASSVNTTSEVAETLEVLDTTDAELENSRQEASVETESLDVASISDEVLAELGVSSEETPDLAAAAATAAAATASETEAVDESKLLDDYVASKTAAEVDDSSRVVITSDVEITEDEKKSLNEFEQFKKMKKG
jgi:hypothetical protein